MTTHLTVIDVIRDKEVGTLKMESTPRVGMDLTIESRRYRILNWEGAMFDGEWFATAFVRPS